MSVRGKDCNVDDSRLIRILLFDDHLTIVHGRGAITLCDNGKSTLHCLEGFVPAVADWHTRTCLYR